MLANHVHDVLQGRITSLKTDFLSHLIDGHPLDGVQVRIVCQAVRVRFGYTEFDKPFFR